MPSCLRAFFLTSSLLLSLPACSGSGSLQIIPTDFRDLDQTRPLTMRVRVHECCYDLDDHGRIRLAFRYRNLALAGPLSRLVFTVSLLLDEPPAGRARTYPLRGPALRGRIDDGAYLHRLRSSWGIAVVWDRTPDALRCKFRLQTHHQRGNVLTGWSGSYPLLLLGDLRATRNPARVNELFAYSEVDDWTR